MEYLAYSLLDTAYAEATEDTEYNLPEFQFQFTWNRQFKSTWLTFASIGTVGALFAVLGQVQPASAAYSGTGRYYVNTNGGNLQVRSGPSVYYPVVDSVSNGASLKRVVRYRNGFAQLSSGNWVSANWISRTRGSSLGVGGRYPCYCGTGGRYHARRAHVGTGGRYQRVVYRPVYRTVYVYQPSRRAMY